MQYVLSLQATYLAMHVALYIVQHSDTDGETAITEPQRAAQMAVQVLKRIMKMIDAKAREECMRAANDWLNDNMVCYGAESLA